MNLIGYTLAGHLIVEMTQAERDTVSESIQQEAPACDLLLAYRDALPINQANKVLRASLATLCRNVEVQHLTYRQFLDRLFKEEPKSIKLVPGIGEAGEAALRAFFGEMEG
jgi:hypothetical protein